MILCLAEFEYGVKLVAQVDDASPELEMEVRPKVLGARAERTDQPADVVLVRSPPAGCPVAASGRPLT